MLLLGKRGGKGNGPDPGKEEKRLVREAIVPYVTIFPPAKTLFRIPERYGEKGRLILLDEYELPSHGVSPVAKIFEAEDGTRIYHVEEPRVGRHEIALYNEVMNILYFEPPVTGEPGEDFEKAIKDAVEDLVNKYLPLYPDADPSVVIYYILRDSIGFLWLDPLIRDPIIEDISCNGANTPVYIWHQRHEYLKTTLVMNESELDTLVLKLVHMGNKHISVANPIADAILPGGHRLAATYKREVTTRGSSFTIRKFRETPITITEMINYRTIDPIVGAYAWIMMEYKRNGLILGITGSGKTTLLNAIATLINPAYKVVTIEDTPELRLPLENWVQLVSREAASQEASITLFDLVKVSLRYRPEIIIVGEVRGEEAYVLFQAMATGHGGLSTLHAENIYGAVERLTSPPMNIPKSYMSLIHFAFLVRRVELNGRTHRRVAFGWEVKGYGDYVEVFRWRLRNDAIEHNLKNSITLRNIAETFEDTTIDELISTALAQKALILYYMAKKAIVSMNEISSIFAWYYRKRDVMLREILDKVKMLEAKDEMYEYIMSLMKR